MTTDRGVNFIQTFLPYPNINRSLECLDYRRLGKQRVEAYQIYRANQSDYKGGWQNHPIARMWRGYDDALLHYMNCSILEWVRRGYNNTMLLADVVFPIEYPPWFSREDFHASHRSNLLRKDKEFYSRYNWSEPDNLLYVWCV